MTDVELKQAISLIKSGDKRGGGLILSSVVKEDPWNEMAWLWLAVCVPSNEQKKACLKRALQINPYNAYTKSLLSKLNLVIEAPSFAEIVSNMPHIVVNEDDAQPAPAVLDFGSVQTSDKAGKQPQDILKSAQAAEESQNYQQAYVYFSQVLDETPEEASAWLGKGRCAGWLSSPEIGKLDEAVLCIKKALDLGVSDLDSLKITAHHLSAAVLIYTRALVEYLTRKHRPNESQKPDLRAWLLRSNRNQTDEELSEKISIEFWEYKLPVFNSLFLTWRLSKDLEVAKNIYEIIRVIKETNISPDYQDAFIQTLFPLLSEIKIKFPKYKPPVKIKITPGNPSDPAKYKESEPAVESQGVDNSKTTLKQPSSVIETTDSSELNTTVPVEQTDQEKIEPLSDSDDSLLDELPSAAETTENEEAGFELESQAANDLIESLEPEPGPEIQTQELPVQTQTSIQEPVEIVEPEPISSTSSAGELAFETVTETLETPLPDEIEAFPSMENAAADNNPSELNPEDIVEPVEISETQWVLEKQAEDQVVLPDKEIISTHEVTLLESENIQAEAESFAEMDEAEGLEQHDTNLPDQPAAFPPPNPLLLSAQSLEKQRAYQEAYEEYAQILEADPNNGDAWLGKSRCLAWLSTPESPKLNEALVCIKNALVNKSPDGQNLAETANSLGLATIEYTQKMARHFADKFHVSAAKPQPGLSTWINKLGKNPANSELYEKMSREFWKETRPIFDSLYLCWELCDSTAIADHIYNALKAIHASNITPEYQDAFNRSLDPILFRIQVKHPQYKPSLKIESFKGTRKFQNIILYNPNLVEDESPLNSISETSAHPAEESTSIIQSTVETSPEVESPEPVELLLTEIEAPIIELEPSQTKAAADEINPEVESPEAIEPVLAEIETLAELEPPQSEAAAIEPAPEAKLPEPVEPVLAEVETLAELEPPQPEAAAIEPVPKVESLEAVEPLLAEIETLADLESLLPEAVADETSPEAESPEPVEPVLAEIETPVELESLLPEEVADETSPEAESPEPVEPVLAEAETFAELEPPQPEAAAVETNSEVESPEAVEPVLAEIETPVELESLLPEATAVEPTPEVELSEAVEPLRTEIETPAELESPQPEAAAIEPALEVESPEAVESVLAEVETLTELESLLPEEATAEPAQVFETENEVPAVDETTPTPETLINSARTFEIEKNYQAAWEHYSRALAGDPTPAEAWLGKGRCAGWLSTPEEPRLSEAVSNINKGLDLGINDSDELSLTAQQLSSAALIYTQEVTTYLAQKYKNETADSPKGIKFWVSRMLKKKSPSSDSEKMSTSEFWRLMGSVLNSLFLSWKLFPDTSIADNIYYAIHSLKGIGITQENQNSFIHSLKPILFEISVKYPDYTPPVNIILPPSDVPETRNAETEISGLLESEPQTAPGVSESNENVVEESLTLQEEIQEQELILPGDAPQTVTEIHPISQVEKSCSDEITLPEINIPLESGPLPAEIQSANEIHPAEETVVELSGPLTIEEVPEDLLENINIASEVAPCDEMDLPELSPDQAEPVLKTETMPLEDGPAVETVPNITETGPEVFPIESQENIPVIEAVQLPEAETEISVLEVDSEIFLPQPVEAEFTEPDLNPEPEQILASVEIMPVPVMPPPNYLEMADREENAGQYQQAYDLYQKVGNDPKAILGQARCAAWISTPENPKLDQAVSLIQQVLENGDFDEEDINQTALQLCAAAQKYTEKLVTALVQKSKLNDSKFNLKRWLFASARKEAQNQKAAFISQQFAEQKYPIVSSLIFAWQTARAAGMIPLIQDTLQTVFDSEIDLPQQETFVRDLEPILSDIKRDYPESVVLIKFMPAETSVEIAPEETGAFGLEPEPLQEEPEFSEMLPMEVESVPESESVETQIFESTIVEAEDSSDQEETPAEIAADLASEPLPETSAADTILEIETLTEVEPVILSESELEKGNLEGEASAVFEDVQDETNPVEFESKIEAVAAHIVDTDQPDDLIESKTNVAVVLPLDDQPEPEPIPEVILTPQEKYLPLAKTAEKKKKYSEAFDFYARVIEYNPQNSDAWLGQSRCSGWLSTPEDQKLDQAVSMLQQALDLGSPNPEDLKYTAIQLSTAAKNYTRGLITHLTQKCKTELSAKSFNINQWFSRSARQQARDRFTAQLSRQFWDYKLPILTSLLLSWKVSKTREVADQIYYTFKVLHESDLDINYQEAFIKTLEPLLNEIKAEIPKYTPPVKIKWDEEYEELIEDVPVDVVETIEPDLMQKNEPADGAPINPTAAPLNEEEPVNQETVEILPIDEDFSFSSLNDPVEEEVAAIPDETTCLEEGNLPELEETLPETEPAVAIESDFAEMDTPDEETHIIENALDEISLPEPEEKESQEETPIAEFCDIPSELSIVSEDELEQLPQNAITPEEEALNQAVEFENKHAYQEACESYDQVLKHNPEHIQAWLGKGRCLAWLSSPESPKINEAMICLNHGIESGLSDADTRSQTAQQFSAATLSYTQELIQFLTQKYKQAASQEKYNFFSKITGTARRKSQELLVNHLSKDFWEAKLDILYGLILSWKIAPQVEVARNIYETIRTLKSSQIAPNYQEAFINTLYPVLSDIEVKLPKFKPPFKINFDIEPEEPPQEAPAPDVHSETIQKEQESAEDLILDNEPAGDETAIIIPAPDEPLEDLLNADMAPISLPAEETDFQMMMEETPIETDDLAGVEEMPGVEPADVNFNVEEVTEVPVESSLPSISEEVFPAEVEEEIQEEIVAEKQLDGELFTEENEPDVQAPLESPSLNNELQQPELDQALDEAVIEETFTNPVETLEAEADLESGPSQLENSLEEIINLDFISADEENFSPEELSLKRARSFEEVLDHANAYRYYEYALKINPENSMAWLGKGRCAGWLAGHDNQKLDEAVSDIKKALDIGVGDIDILRITAIHLSLSTLGYTQKLLEILTEKSKNEAPLPKQGWGWFGSARKQTGQQFSGILSNYFWEEKLPIFNGLFLAWRLSKNIDVADNIYYTINLIKSSGISAEYQEAFWKTLEPLLFEIKAKFPKYKPPAKTKPV